METAVFRGRVVMARTGRDLPHVYRETAEGGLAIVYRYPPAKK